MDREKITERIYVESDSMNANVIVDGKIVKRFKNNEMSYIDAMRHASDIMFKQQRESKSSHLGWL